MEFSSWPVEELKALAIVYVKHKQHQKACALRNELAIRLKEKEDPRLKQLFDQLNSSNVTSLTERIFGRAKWLA